jgi:D-arabinose 1-dehydrogenase-like Zn-dependent alcohol dehydrogenase
MKALAWHGKHDLRCESVPDPKIEHPRDAVIKVTACAICGSDLHIYDGIIPRMKTGDVLGHETMGEVVEVGTEKKMDPAEVARQGFKAMMDGDGDVVTGWQNKLQSAIALITPAGTAAEQHRKMAAPGTAKGWKALTASSASPRTPCR